MYKMTSNTDGKLQGMRELTLDRCWFINQKPECSEARVIRHFPLALSHPFVWHSPRFILIISAFFKFSSRLDNSCFTAFLANINIIDMVKIKILLMFHKGIYTNICKSTFFNERPHWKIFDVHTVRIRNTRRVNGNRNELFL